MRTVLQVVPFFLLFLCLLLTQCSKTPDAPVTPKNSTKTLTSPIIDGVAGALYTFDAVTSTYTLTVPSGTDVTALKVSFTLPTGATANPTLGSAQNFTNPVVYTVRAEDGSTQTYTVKVVVTGAPKQTFKQIVTFTFSALNPAVSASIDPTTRKITAIIPADADITKLIPTITLSPKATVSPASGVVQNFSNPVNYTVTAEDGSTQVYEVSVTKQTISIDNIDVVYLSDYQTVYALDASTGKKIWGYFLTGSDNIVSGITVDNGILYFGDDRGYVRALDTKTGKQKWVNQYAIINSTPLVANGVLYFGSENSFLWAVDAATGTKKWNYKLNNGNAVGGPTILDNVLYVGDDSGTIVALDATTGTSKWIKKYDIFNFTNNPVIIDNILCIQGSSKGPATAMSYGLDSKTGNVKWRQLLFPFGNAPYNSGENNSVTVYNNVEYHCTSDYSTNGFITARNINDGGVIWSLKTGANFSSPYYYNGTIYSVSSDGFYAVNAIDGTTKWKLDFADTGTPIKSSPLVVNNTVFTSGEKSRDYFYALDALTGTKKWTFKSELFFTRVSPVVVTKDGKVYHPSDSGAQN